MRRHLTAGRIVALEAALALAACNPAPAPHRTPAHTAPPTTAASLPPLRILGRGTKHRPVRISQSEGGRIVYRIVADAYEGTSSLALARLHRATVSFFDRSGAMLQARAPDTLVDEKRNRVTMDGGVHARGSNGRTLDCDQLVYDRSNGTIHAVGDVVIVQNGNGTQATAHGNELDSDITLTRTVMR